MTALRVWHTARPSLVGARVLPMDETDRQFWKLRRERKAREEGDRK